MAKKRPTRIVSPLDVSNSMWLTRNGLRARNLTIMQVLDPVVVKVKSSSVPMFSSNAVRQVLTTRPRKSKKGYTYLLNDLGNVDLNKYEEDLTVVISEYKQRLDAIMWRSLSQKERDKFGESWPVSYLQNQTAYHQAMDNLGWPISYYEVQLLVDEIFLAEFYLKQCRLLLNINSQQVLVRFDELGATLHCDVRYREGAKVVARDTDDGFYYNGIIQQCLSSRKFVVRFCLGKEVIVSKKHCHLKNKDKKTATFKMCDCVLVNTGANSEEACYYPGLIIGIPGKYQLKNSDYIILLYDCTKVFAFKENLIRINSGSYAKTVKYIERHWQPDADISGDESTTDTMDDLIKTDLVTTALSEASSSTDEDDDPNQQIADSLHENLQLCEEKLAQATAEQAALKEMLKSQGDQIHELMLTVGKKLVKN